MSSRNFNCCPPEKIQKLWTMTHNMQDPALDTWRMHGYMRKKLGGKATQFWGGLVFLIQVVIVMKGARALAIDFQLLLLLCVSWVQMVRDNDEQRMSSWRRM
ncbi:hypothetical protein FA15DRAFT_663769 [Coprinopsis marcescibilis]|uniref:Uncharacterized protein n=1 Tax=Coprinopsis marcescibilis TaxID=230819 RepID=A0A5C3LA25_COPMA|nr:hypothetical protein FA15DRAFT_663769 [Coprinopsis marcescibilis]